MDKKQLIKELVEEGHLKSKRVIAAFRKVPREKFVPVALKSQAYINEPLPIGEGQTISQPLTVADMTEALDVKQGHKVLEVGAGSGYQAAILSEIVGTKGKVFTIERVRSLAERAMNTLKSYKNVQVIEGDGTLGLPQHAPYDRIIVTATAPTVPKPLKEQLKVGGKMVIPVGGLLQVIKVLKKKKNGFDEEVLGFYAFVPLIGKFGYTS